MRLVLDLQGAQTRTSRHRGIGRYSISLARAMARRAGKHELWLALSGAFPESIQSIRSEFDGVLPQRRIVAWETLSGTAEVEPGNTERKRIALHQRAHFLAGLRPDIVHVSSLFEGWADDVATTTTSGVPDVPTAVTVYDLIPLSDPQAYLADPRSRAWYERKVEELKTAGLCLAISEHTRREAMSRLGIPPGRIVNVAAAADERFRRLSGSIDEVRTLARHGIHRPFLMCAGGFDPRKNIPALFRAYAALPAPLRQRHQLAIVGGVLPHERQTLEDAARAAGLADGEVVVTGYVSDDDLVKLYNLCALYVFPSLHEGFGLPALEAMACGAVVIGSDTSSLPEVIGHPAARFDPTGDRRMTEAIARALTEEGLRDELRRYGAGQAGKFSWDESARRALEALEECHLRAAAARSAPSTWIGGAQQQPALAIVPLPVGNGGHGGESLLSHLPALSRHFRVTVVAVPGARLEASIASIDVRTFGDREHSYDHVVYELDDAGEAAAVLDLLERFGGWVWLRSASLTRALQAGSGRLLARLAYRAGGYRLARRFFETGKLTTEDLLPWVGSRAEVVFMPAGADAAAAERLAQAPVSLRGGEDPCDQLLQHAAVGGRAALGRLGAEVSTCLDRVAADQALWRELARMTVGNGRQTQVAARRFLVDVSALAKHDARTGIQRVVRNLLRELETALPEGDRLEPVYFKDDGECFHAHRFFSRFAGYPYDVMEDEPVITSGNDVFIGLDLSAHIVPFHRQRFERMRDQGIPLIFVVYDLLPLRRPECFDPRVVSVFQVWYEVIAEIADGVLCISRAVADEFLDWMDQWNPSRDRPLRVGHFPLGANLDADAGGAVLTPAEQQSLEGLPDERTFLMVSTLEPRKGHIQTLDAFELLWADGVDASLIIVGKQGWLVDELVERLRHHPELGRHLFWFERVSDAMLLTLYRRSSALLAASEGEGFGLPLVEAAQHGLAIVCRDLPVFREVAGEHAHYFEGHDEQGLADALRSWLDLHAVGTAPRSDGIVLTTWRDSARQFLRILLEEGWYANWLSPSRRWFPAYDHRLGSEVGVLRRGEYESDGRAGYLVHGPYVEMAAGRYRLRAHGQLLADPGQGCCIDVTVDSGQERLFERRPQPNGGRGTLLVDDVLELREGVQDLEIRVFVGSSTRIRIRGFELIPIESQDEKERSLAGRGTTVTTVSRE